MIAKPVDKFIRRAVVVMGCAACLGFGQDSSVTSVISGRVVDESGAVVSGAVVRYSRVPRLEADVVAGETRYALAPGETERGGVVPTDAGGDFATEALPSGKYSLCVSPPLGFLDPCRWHSRTEVVVDSGETATDVQLTTRRGAVVRIEVDDPKQQVRFGSGPGGFRNLILGVMTSGGAFDSARVLERSGTLWKLAVTVDYEVPLKLWVFSRHLQLVDEGRGTLNMEGPNQDFIFVRGESDRIFRLAVAGALADRK